MPDPGLMVVIATSSDQTTDMLHRAAGTAEGQVVGIESAVSHDISQFPLLQHLSEVMPAADVVVGAAMLILIMLMHAAGVRATSNHVLHRSGVLLAEPSSWRADVLMSSTVFALLGLHLLEMTAWALALVYSGLVPDWRAAGFFAGNTYTTVGYGNFILPDGWKMLGPIIAISGLFTFGWSGSVLVDLVGRCQKIKDAAASP
jgi:Ion channel